MSFLVENNPHAIRPFELYCWSRIIHTKAQGTGYQEEKEKKLDDL